MQKRARSKRVTDKFLQKRARSKRVTIKLLQKRAQIKRVTDKLLQKRARSKRATIYIWHAYSVRVSALSELPSITFFAILFLHFY